MSVHQESAAWREASTVPSSDVSTMEARATSEPTRSDGYPSARTFLIAIVALSVGLIVFSIAVRAPIDPAALTFLGP